jgi:hypothetical protein
LWRHGPNRPARLNLQLTPGAHIPNDAFHVNLLCPALQRGIIAASSVPELCGR